MVDGFTLHDTRSSTLLWQGMAGSLLLRPVEDRLMLRHLASFETNPLWEVQWQPSPPATVRYWFDSWPQPWMGLTVAEEIAFGQPSWSETDALTALSHWQLSYLPLDSSILNLTHVEAVRVMLARAELSGCDLLLMEQPDAGLSDTEAQSLAQDLRTWLQRSAALAVVTTNRSLFH